jgi:uncharacterized membrane protein YfcA
VNEHLVGRRELALSLGLLPAALLGTWAGQRLVRKVPQQTFRRIVLILLLITGMVGGVAALRQVA